MLINNIFANNLSEAKTYYDEVVKLLRPSADGAILPHYYYVPVHVMELERKNPGSQERLPSQEAGRGSYHLWAQAMWIISQLLGK